MQYTSIKCEKCFEIYEKDIPLCIDGCFKEFHLNPEKILKGHKPKVQKNKVIKEQGASNQEESKET